MPLKPSARAEASRQISALRDLTQVALLTSDGEDQVTLWRLVANATGEVHKAVIGAVGEALDAPRRGRGK